MNLQPAGRIRYKNLKKEEYNRIWDIEKAHKMRKLDKFPGIPEFFQGVGLGEDCLESEFGNPVIEPIVLGGIQASENMKAFLRKPLKFRVFPKVRLKDNKVEAESTAAKKRWTQSDVKAHPGETFGERAARLEETNWKKQPEFQGDGKVNFSKVRATDLLCNKQISMPEAGEWEEEVIIQQQQLEVLNIIERYLNNECDEFGNPSGSINLTKQEDLGRKEILRGVKDRKDNENDISEELSGEAEG